MGEKDDGKGESREEFEWDRFGTAGPVTNAPTAAPGAKRWPSDECSQCGRPGAEHEFVPDPTSKNFKYKGVAGYLRCPAPDAGNVAPPQAVSGSIEDVRNYSIRPAPGAMAGALKGCLVVCAEIREPHLFGSHCINARLAYPGDVCGYCRRPYLTMGGGCDCDGWKAAEALDAGAEKARETGNYGFSEIAKTSTDAGDAAPGAKDGAPMARVCLTCGAGLIHAVPSEGWFCPACEKPTPLPLKFSYAGYPVDVFTIEGNKFSGDVFRFFGAALNVGKLFRLVSVEDGVITIKVED